MRLVRVFLKYRYMVGKTYNWDTVCRCNGADVVSTSDTTGNGSLLVLVSNTLSSEVCSTTLGHLEDDWGLGIASSLEGCNDGRGRGNVDGWDGILVLLSVVTVKMKNQLLLGSIE